MCTNAQKYKICIKYVQCMFINGELTLKSVKSVKYDRYIKCNQLINTILVRIQLWDELKRGSYTVKNIKHLLVMEMWCENLKLTLSRRTFGF